MIITTSDFKRLTSNLKGCCSIVVYASHQGLIPAHSFILDLSALKADSLFTLIKESLHLQASREKPLYVLQAELLSATDVSALKNFLESFTGFHQLVLFDPLVKNTALSSYCQDFYLQSTGSTPPTPQTTTSLRDLIAPYYRQMPSKDDRGLLQSISQLIQALPVQESQYPEDLLQTLQSLNQTLKSDLTGHLQARAVKWACYRYLKKIKNQAKQP